jgi:hypothetical protein
MEARRLKLCFPLEDKSLEPNRQLTLDLPAPGLFVQTLGVPLFNNLQRSIDVNFNEWNRRVVCLMQLSSELSVRDVGRDEGGQGDACRRGKEKGDFADSSDVFFSVLGSETEVLSKVER